MMHKEFGSDLALGLRRRMGIVRALEWAFGTECAQLEFDDGPEPVRPAVSTVWVMMMRGQLGCEIDGGGSSRPASDAEVIAAVVSALPEAEGGRVMAVQIAELARAGRRPDWMKGAQPRCVPAEWRQHKNGWYARTETVETITVRHRGRLVRRPVPWCPVAYTPSARQIGAARRNWLAWVGALIWIASQLRALDLMERIEITDALPPIEPWRDEGG